MTFLWPFWRMNKWFYHESKLSVSSLSDFHPNKCLSPTLCCVPCCPDANLMLSMQHWVLVAPLSEMLIYLNDHLMSLTEMQGLKEVREAETCLAHLIFGQTIQSISLLNAHRE